MANNSQKPKSSSELKDFARSPDYEQILSHNLTVSFVRHFGGMPPAEREGRFPNVICDVENLDNLINTQLDTVGVLVHAVDKAQNEVEETADMVEKFKGQFLPARKFACPPCRTAQDHAELRNLEGVPVNGANAPQHTRPSTIHQDLELYKTEWHEAERELRSLKDKCSEEVSMLLSMLRERHRRKQDDGSPRPRKLNDEVDWKESFDGSARLEQGDGRHQLELRARELDERSLQLKVERAELEADRARIMERDAQAEKSGG